MQRDAGFGLFALVASNGYRKKSRNMLQPGTILRPATDCLPASKDYFLENVTLEIADAQTAIFRARLNGPAGSQVWARGWLSTEADGTLAETASPCLNAGDTVTLTVALHDNRIPESAFMRMESAPLATEHVVVIKILNAGTGHSL